MKRILSVFILPLFPFLAEAQTVSVFDRSSARPLPDVRISTSAGKHIAVTNGYGKFGLNDLSDKDTLLFNHLGYQPMRLAVGQIRNLNYRVFLPEKSVELDEYVVSASRFTEPKRETAAQIEIIKREDVENMNQPTTAEMLSQTGKVFVQKSQLGGGSPVMRGFEASRVLIVVDGVRMNNAIFRAGHLQNVLRIDQNILDRTELVFGPGSVMYGSDALGGVLHFYTRDPLLAQEKKFRHDGNAFIRYGSATNEITGHVDVSLASRRFGSITSVTFSQFGDQMQGNIRNPGSGNLWDRTFYVKRIDNKDSVIRNANTNKQVGSGYYQYDILQKFLFKQSDKVSHVLNLQFSNSSNVNRYDRLTEKDGSGNPRSAEWYYGPERRIMASYRARLSKGPFYDRANITVAYQNIEESRHNRNLNAANRTSRIEKVNVLTANLDFDLRVADKHILRYGLEGTYNDVNSSAFRTNVNTGNVAPTATTRYPDGGSRMYSAAAYFTHTWEINSRWTLAEGIRFSYVGLDARFSDTLNIHFPFDRAAQQNYALNGNLSLIYNPGRNWRLALVGSTGFRSPNVDDLSKVFDSQPGTVIVPNPNIRPEYSANVDLNLSKTFYGKVRVEAVGYFTWLWDAISSRPFRFNGQDSILYDGTLSRVLANVNANHGFVTGASFNVTADVHKYFALEGSLGYTYGRLRGDTSWVPLDHVAPLYGRLGAVLKLKKFRGEFYTLFNGRKSAKDYATSGEDNIQYATPAGMPGWYTLNLRASYSINSYLRIQLGLENLLDARYRYFASGISSPGRNVTVTVRTRF